MRLLDQWYATQRIDRSTSDSNKRPDKDRAFRLYSPSK